MIKDVFCLRDLHTQVNVTERNGGQYKIFSFRHEPLITEKFQSLLHWNAHLSACSGLINTERWRRWAGSEVERSSWTVKVKGAGISIHTEHTHTGAPGLPCRQQRISTQPWPTSRSNGSSGSLKKLSRAKRCGNVKTPLWLQRRFSVASIGTRLTVKLAVDVVTETQIAAANVGIRRRGAAGGAWAGELSLALA